jgi:hypothetical protein
MNEKIKNQMLLNAESYEFFLEKTREIEKQFFSMAASCTTEMERVVDELEELGVKPNTAQYDLSISRRINLNIFSETVNEGQKYLTISKKFIDELEMMKDLAPNILELSSDELGIEHTSVEEFVDDYTDNINKSQDMQRKVDILILNELKMLKNIIKMNS